MLAYQYPEPQYGHHCCLQIRTHPPEREKELTLHVSEIRLYVLTVQKNNYPLGNGGSHPAAGFFEFRFF